jgi:peptidoglycan/xylan/chitin deacetylase (PgdA/CDA1 family)
MSASLPVLTFHAIHDLPSPVAFGPAAFSAAMRRLAARGWRTVSAAEAVAHARGGRPASARTFAITFDDGYASVLTHAAPVLRELGFGATLFLTTGLMERDEIFPGDRLCPRERSLSWAEARALAASGIEIGSHATEHRDLRTLSDAELSRALSESRRVLEERLGTPVRLHAYPFGLCDARVAAAAARVYDGAFTADLDWVRPGVGPHRMPRLDAHYLRFLGRCGDLGGAGTRGWIALRRLGRAVRAALAGRGGGA